MYKRTIKTFRMFLFFHLFRFKISNFENNFPKINKRAYSGLESRENASFAGQLSGDLNSCPHQDNLLLLISKLQGLKFKFSFRFSVDIFSGHFMHTLKCLIIRLGGSFRFFGFLGVKVQILIVNK